MTDDERREHKRTLSRAANARYKAKNPERRLAQTRAAGQTYRATQRGKEAFRGALKRQQARHHERIALARAGGCADCGTHDGPLHFHHVDPSTKLHNVTSMDTYSDEAFYAELAKCVVVCWPCHRKRHEEIESKRIAERTVAEQSSLNISDDAADTAA